MKKILIALLAVFALLVAASAIIAAFADKGALSISDKVALVRIEGPIIDSADSVEEIKDFADDDSIKAIVIRIDSPGGAVGPSQEIYDQVRRAAEKKSVVASMGSIAASGGYYIAAPASRIVANPGTLTGSIGVIMEIPNVEGLMDKVGIKTTVIKSGRHKDMASMFRQMGDEERAILQGVLDDVHDQFIVDVANARGMPVDKVREMADGRVFTGRQAIEVGLVDELGGLQDAIEASAELAGIDGEPEVVTKKKKLSIIEMLRGDVSGEIRKLFPQVQLKYVFSP